MAKFIKIEDDFYISATSTYADDRTRVLNHGDTFGVFDRWGDIQPIGQQVQGLYHEGTRYVSAFEFRLGGERPLLLSSTINENNEILTVDLTNPELKLAGDVVVPQSKIHVFRTKYLNKGRCYESIKLANYDTMTYELEVTFSFSADYKDIFEIRGKGRERRGELEPAEVLEGNQLKHHYRGLDGQRRSTVHYFTPQPDEILPHVVSYRISLAPKQVYQIQLKTGFELGDAPMYVLEEPIEEAARDAARFDRRLSNLPSISTSNEQFNHWLNRSKTDLVSLVADTPWGRYPYAGIPWFNTAFGRDGIITAYEVLWLMPDLARDVLRYLAKTQATKEDAFMDAEPGKIMHETRKGEMAELGEIPYKLYYGTVDATPLFIMLAGAYYQRTGDLHTISELWPNLEAALLWIDEYGDLNGDGYVEYQKKSKGGLIHQGWKDADDAVNHADGRLAVTPVALCEVQGYVYSAKLQMALLAEKVGNKELAGRLRKEAEALKLKFNAQFWDEELQCFVIGFDGDKKPCRVKSSNAGHVLFTEIADPALVEKQKETLFSEEMFSGWGIRTLATDAPRYNPMSYHNGTIWPHDNALIAWGLSKYGHTDGVLKIFEGLYSAAMHTDLQRLPELFCGFERRRGEGPTTYPVACSPQAWAVATVFMLLQASLRININALKKRVVFNRPVLPEWMDYMIIRNLPLGKMTLTIEFRRYNGSVGINVVEKPHDWEVLEIR